MKCPTCNSNDMSVTRNGVYRYAESGLPNAVLVGIEVRRCPNCGEEMPVIQRIAELHRAMAMMVIGKKSRLAGAEIRFLRKFLGHSSEDFASLIGVARSTLSRWENNKEQPGTTVDRFLRLLVVTEKRVDGYEAKQLSGIEDSARTAPIVRFERKSSGWSHADGP